MQGTAEPIDFVHSAAFYRGDREYLDTLLPFVMQGLDAGDPVVAVVPARNLHLLRDALGHNADRVEMSDMEQVGRNPANTFAAFSAALADDDRHRRMWIVAEPIWPGRSREEYPACVQNEALYNTAFAGHRVATLCPYDAAGLSERVLADARRTHPLIHVGGEDVPCPEFSWQTAFAEFNQPLVTAPTAATYDIAHPGDLSTARSFAAQRAHELGLSADRISDLHLIVTELATNSLKYTPGGCRLAVWVSNGKLVCEVRDHGRLDDPLAGRRPAAANATGGRGLLLVNALADLVRMHTSDTGTTIQVFLSLEQSEERVE